MSVTLYLIEAKAKREYICPGCHRTILRGELHFRHDPHPYARVFRGQPTTHWCRRCIISAAPGPKDMVTGRIRVPAVQVVGADRSTEMAQLSFFSPVQIEVIGIGQIITQQLLKEPSLIHQISPNDFEEFICDRLYAMGFEPKRVGPTYKKDGGIDVLFWPRTQSAFPFLGAAQVKHHKNPLIKEGPANVREFNGSIVNYPFSVGLLITNTSFTPDAIWYAREHANLIRLRDLQDIRRWLLNNFGDNEEWREIPSAIELCPGVIVKIR